MWGPCWLIYIDEIYDSVCLNCQIIVNFLINLQSFELIKSTLYVQVDNTFDIHIFQVYLIKFAFELNCATYLGLCAWKENQS
jgi:hypothetical protein